MRKNEGGFTLVELLVTITILVALGGALAQAMIVGLRTTDASNARLGVSREAQLAAAYFATDVQSAMQVPSTDPPCLPAVEAGWTRTRLVHLQGLDGSTVTNTYYALESKSSPTARRLRRTSCSGGALRSHHVVADELAANPILACDPSTCTSPRSITVTLEGDGGYRYELSGTRRVVAGQ